MKTLDDLVALVQLYPPHAGESCISYYKRVAPLALPESEWQSLLEMLKAHN